MHPQQVTSTVNLLSAMGTTQIVLLIVLIALIALSAFFSATETAYSSCNKIRLKSLESGGSKRAARALKQLDHYDRVISTVLVGNNIVNITMTSIATVFFIELLRNTTAEQVAVTVSTIVMTVLVLIFGEITPKTLAKEHAEGWVCAVAPVMSAIMVVLFPINWLFSMWKKLMNKVFKKKEEQPYTEDELITIVETAHSEGGIDEHESQLIRSAIEFEDMDVDDIMVPRVNVAAFEETAPLDEISELFASSGFSRLPVYNKTIDTIVGVLHEKDFYQLLRENGRDIREKITPCICVSLNMKISKVLRMLQKAKVHMAIVVDEFGGTAGIVTLEDILEELVGEIWDEHDEVEVLYKRIDDNPFLVQGNENLEDMFDELDVETKEEFDSTTVGGWVTEQMQKIPVSGESFEFENLDITVTKANSRRVLEVKIKVNEKPEQEEEEGPLQKVIKRIEEKD